MAAVTFEDRATGSLLGALVGEALGVGPHWYYNLNELRAHYGEWIDGYVAPREGRYHDGLRPGQSSQPGWLLELTMRSLADSGGYDEADFCRRLDEDLFPLLDGTPHHGPGGYTSQSIREAYRLRQQGRPWGEVGGYADTTEAAERVLAIAVRYAGDLSLAARAVASNTALTQIDPTVAAMTTAFGATLGLLVRGEPLEARLSGTLMGLASDGTLPSHASPDALLLAGTAAGAAHGPGIRIEPAWKVAQVYGMPCAIYYQLPAAYYLAARFPDDFESAVLHAVNGGGQNQARAMLTGALVGAMVGLSGIPQRFVDGLERRDEYLALARRIASQAAAS